MTQRAARCYCEQLRLVCQGAPRKVSMCHCLECQRRTGSALSVAAFYERDLVKVVKGITRSYQRVSASGLPVTFHFCENYGLNVYWEPACLPRLTGIAVGAFVCAQNSWPHTRRPVCSRPKTRGAAPRSAPETVASTGVAARSAASTCERLARASGGKASPERVSRTLRVPR